MSNKMNEVFEDLINEFNYEFLFNVPDGEIYDKPSFFVKETVNKNWYKYYMEIMNGHHPFLYLLWIKEPEEVFTKFLIKQIRKRTKKTDEDIKKYNDLVKIN